MVIEKDVVIPDSVKLYGTVHIGSSTIIGENTVLGYPSFENKDVKNQENKDKPTTVGKKCKIGSNVVIYSGARIDDGVEVDDFCRIGNNTTIGIKSHILYGAKIYNDVRIGNHSIIGGFCPDYAKIGNHVTMFGNLIHNYRQPFLEWGSIDEASPIIEDYVVVGYNALVIGGIRICKNTYIAAGAIVIRDVPPKSVVIGINNIIPHSQWKGKLKKCGFFEVKHDEK